MASKQATTKIRINLVLVVPTNLVGKFHLDLIKRMHKYLAKNAVVVHAVDSEIE